MLESVKKSGSKRFGCKKVVSQNSEINSKCKTSLKSLFKKKLENTRGCLPVTKFDLVRL